MFGNNSPSGAQIRALLGLGGPQRVTLDRPKVSFPAPRPSAGTIKATPKRSIARTIEDTTGDLLRRAGVDQHDANRWAGKLFGAFNDLTPVGNVTGAQEGYGLLKQGITRGDLATGAAGLGSLLLSVVPFGGAAKRKPLQSLMRDESGAIRAWHGSPHDFDKFEWSPRTRGTGEGAQAYGDGLYFAENRDVAEEYQRNLTKRAAKPTFGGRLLDSPTAWQGTMNELESAGSWRNAKALEMVDSFIRQHGNAELAGRELRNWYRNDPKMLAAVEGVLPQVEMQVPKGRLYEVNINAEPEDFLDWDAPLAQQPKAMQALGSIDLSHLPQGNRTRVLLERAGTVAEQAHYPATGRELLNAVSGYGEQRAGDLMALQPYGIKGVQFLDQGSRGAGQGTRNFVVPDHRLIDILAKY